MEIPILNESVDSDAIPMLALLVLKELDSINAEGVALSYFLRSKWKKQCSGFIDKILNKLSGELTGVDYQSEIIEYQLTLGQDFIDQTSEIVGEYAIRSYLIGVKEIANSRVLKAPNSRVRKDLFDSISEATGAKRQNVKRAIKRWFKQTNGQYFDRFIKEETFRLAADVAEAGGNVITLNMLGRRYKKFVLAEGYWDAISKFTTAQARVFGSIDAMGERNVDRFRIRAVFDNRTCDRCQTMHGTEWSIHDAESTKSAMLLLGAEEAAQAFPWPTRDIIKLPKDEIPFSLPPYHPRCRCTIVPV